MSHDPDDVSAEVEHVARRHQRLDVRIQAALREAGRHRFEVEILDLSEGGCQLDTRFYLKPGSRIWLAFPGLSAMQALVAWNRGWHYGCQFEPPLHPAIFDHTVKRHAR